MNIDVDFFNAACFVEVFLNLQPSKQESWQRSLATVTHTDPFAQR